MAEFFALAKELNKATDAGEREKLAASMFAAGNLMGLLQSDADSWFAGDDDGELSGDEIDGLIAERNQARADRDFQRADEIRDQLADAGIRIEDGADGTTWRRGA